MPGIRQFGSSVLIGAAAIAAHGQTLQLSVEGGILPGSAQTSPSALAHAGNTNRGVDQYLTTFAKPVTTAQLDWRAIVLTDTVGWHSTDCRIHPARPGIDGDMRGWRCDALRSDVPEWSFGNGSHAASAGGRIRYETGTTLHDATPAGQVRFRVLDTFGAKIEVGGSSASTRLDQGRAQTRASMSYVPPRRVGDTVCTADLVLELHFGIDGMHQFEPEGSLRAWRWLDLDLVYSGLSAPGRSDIPRGAIRIRARGQPPSAARGSGWSNGGTVERSTVHFERSADPREPETFSWGNGTVAGGAVTGDAFDHWRRKVVRVPLQLPTRTAFELRVLSHQAHALSRAYLGSTQVPTSAMPGTPSARQPRGHGIDVRLYLDNFKPTACKPRPS